MYGEKSQIFPNWDDSVRQILFRWTMLNVECSLYVRAIFIMETVPYPKQDTFENRAINKYLLICLKNSYAKNKMVISTGIF
jgi:hypothetical protein